MKLVTWNVNSLKARLPRVVEFLEAERPEIAFLQETKCEDAAFPEAELRELGIHAAHHSAGRWAGVALLSTEPLEDAVAGLPGEAAEDEARWIEATTHGLRVASAYVPNGRAVDHPAFGEKLQFLEAMRERAAAAVDVVAGDFNVTRDDRDVYDPAAFAGSTHVTPEERSRLEAVLEAGGLVDALRHVHPDGQHFTWWDYRQGHFHRGLGLRIDYVLVAERLAGDLRECGVRRDFRKGTKPSDHAPLVAELG